MAERRVIIPRQNITRREGPRGLEIVIPAPRIPVLLVFIGAWLAGWAFGEASALKSFVHAPFPVQAFLLLWLTGWTVGGGFFLWAWLWLAFGVETVRVDGMRLFLRKEVLGLGKTRVYPLAEVRNLRVEPYRKGDGDGVRSPRSAGKGSLRRGIGAIAFDFRGLTHRFGLVADEEEARRLAEELTSRYSIPRGMENA